MKKLEIIFTKSKKRFALISWIIRKYTNKEYSHVARKLKISFLKNPCYFQANEGKVNWEYEPHFLNENEIVKTYSFDIPDSLHKQFNIACWESVGQNYGYLQNIGIFIVEQIKKYLNVDIKNPWKSGANCSEIIYLTILKPMFPDLDYDPDTIKPDDIEYILLNKQKSGVLKFY